MRKSKLGLLLVIMAVLVAACGGDGGSEATTTSEATATTSGSSDEATTVPETDTTTAVGDEFTVGAILSLTGQAASYGAMAQGGIDLKVAEVNEAGGICGADLVIAYEDNQLDPAIAATAAQKLAGQGVRIAYTHGSSLTLGVSPVADQEGMLLVNIAAQSPAILESPSVYSFLPTNDMALGAMADLAYDTLGFTDIAIIHSDDDYGVSAAGSVVAAFEAKGGTITANESHPVGVTDMRTELIKIQGTNPQGLVVLSNSGEIGYIIKQAKEIGLEAQILGADSTLSPSEREIAGDAFEGTMGIAIRFDPASGEEAAQFAADFEEAYGMEPNNYAAIAYVATELLAEAMNDSCSDDPAAVGAYFLTIKDRETILGPTTFREDRVIEFPITEWKWENGELVVIG